MNEYIRELIAEEQGVNLEEDYSIFCPSCLEEVFWDYTSTLCVCEHCGHRWDIRDARG